MSAPLHQNTAHSLPRALLKVSIASVRKPTFSYEKKMYQIMFNRSNIRKGRIYSDYSHKEQIDNTLKYEEAL